MTRRFFFYLLLAAVVLMAPGCSKKVQPVVEINSPEPQVVNNTGDSVAVINMTPYYQADWSSIKCGGNARIAAAGKSLKSSMHMRMHRGKAIYISLRPVMGIEAAKLVISDDSILLVDKLHKRYMHEKASLLTNGVPVTVQNLQDIFLGRAFELGKGSLTATIKDDFAVEKDASGKVMLKPKAQYRGFDYCFVYDKSNNIVSLDVHPSKGNGAYSVKYDDVRGTVAGKVAGSVKVSTSMGGKPMSLELDYKDMTWNEAFTIDSSVSSKYKRVEGNNIMNLLGN